MRLHLIVALLFAAIASAKKCKLVPKTGCYLCGKVNNNTPWPLRMTQDPSGLTGSLPKGWNLCDIFNWDSNGRCPNGPCKCHQEVVAAGKSRGGNSCNDKESERTDVDAITFADRDWYYTHWSAPVPHKVKKGTWLKFNDVETANCNDERYPWPWSSKVPMCHVVLSG